MELVDTNVLLYTVSRAPEERPKAAFATRSRWRLSYWDAAILEAARAGGCEVVLSEDLADEEDYGGVRVENPFRDAAG